VNGLTLAVVALFGTIATGFGTWLVARRSTSGSVRTSEAETLWSESQAIRTELREEVKGLRLSVDQLRVEVRDCHTDGAALRQRLSALEGRTLER